jgi:hypothetical protein
MKDVTSWPVTGYGENSTLEKYDILSPDGENYVIKFPREFDGKRTNWEDVNEVVAAKIASLLHLPVVDAEIAYRDERRACLMKNFRSQSAAEDGDTAAALFYSEFGSEYEALQNSEWKNEELMKSFFQLFTRYSRYEDIKTEFVFMNLFDILIGNQDRHGHNWQILFKNGLPVFAPLYDNGASLGWQLPDDELEMFIFNESKMNKFYKKTQVKMGMDNKETPRIKAKQVLNYLIENYSSETKQFMVRLEQFDFNAYSVFLEDFPLMSLTRKNFLLELVKFRKGKIEEVVRRGGI